MKKLLILTALALFLLACEVRPASPPVYVNDNDEELVKAVGEIVETTIAQSSRPSSVMVLSMAAVALAGVGAAVMLAYAMYQTMSTWARLSFQLERERRQRLEASNEPYIVIDVAGDPTYVPLLPPKRREHDS